MTATIISVAAVLVSLVTFALTYLASQTSERRNRMPVLVLFPDDKGWRLQNVGNGPALNIVIAQGRGGQTGGLIEMRSDAIAGGGAAAGEVWCNPIHLRPMASGADQLVPWQFSSTGVGISFTDALNKPYTLRTSRQGSQLFERQAIPEWEDREWRQLSAVESWATERARTGSLPRNVDVPWGERGSPDLGS